MMSVRRRITSITSKIAETAGFRGRFDTKTAVEQIERELGGRSAILYQYFREPCCQF
jgi:hypothetical protein